MGDQKMGQALAPYGFAYFAHNVGGGDEIELTNNLNIVGPQFSILICILGLGLAVNKNKRRRERVDCNKKYVDACPIWSLCRRRFLLHLFTMGQKNLKLF